MQVVSPLCIRATEPAGHVEGGQLKGGRLEGHPELSSDDGLEARIERAEQAGIKLGKWLWDGRKSLR